MASAFEADLTSSFEVNFCGSEFWSLNETWYTDDPDFTRCFHKTVLAWIPSAFFFFFAIFELKKITSNSKGKISWNTYNLTKVIITLSLIAVSVAEIALIAKEASDGNGVDIYPVDYLAPSVYLLTFVGSMGLLLLTIRYGSRTSSSQFYLYFFWVICGGITLRSIVRTETSEDPNVLLITYTITYVMVCAMFILNLFADSAPSSSKDEAKDCPRLSASYFSKLIYMWSVKLLWNGWRKPLEPSDLWDLDPKLTSK
jgi:ATP-binding cassette subfamily C (CFTR/MRP) protein 1